MDTPHCQVKVAKNHVTNNQVPKTPTKNNPQAIQPRTTAAPQTKDNPQATK